MLNYIWAGLVLSSVFFALGSDLWNYDTGAQTLAARAVGGGVEIALPDGPVTFAATFDEEARTATLAADADLPPPLVAARDHLDEDGGPLVFNLVPDGAGGFRAELPPVRWVKLTAVTRAAFDFAETAVTLALSLIGVLALWLGLLKIGERAGLIENLVVLFRPILRPLFPSLPSDSPAFAMIALNVTANVLGLGNAATPLGLKAMEELQKLNPTDDTATDPMVMLLAINTASVTLVPPVTLIAIMGVEAGRLTVPIIVTTAMSLVIAVAAVKLWGLIPAFRNSNPDLLKKELA